MVPDQDSTIHFANKENQYVRLVVFATLLLLMTRYTLRYT